MLEKMRRGPSGKTRQELLDAYLASKNEDAWRPLLPPKPAIRHKSERGILMKRLHTEITIDAPAEKVWEVFSDFRGVPGLAPLPQESHDLGHGRVHGHRAVGAPGRQGDDVQAEAAGQRRAP